MSPADQLLIRVYSCSFVGNACLSDSRLPAPPQTLRTPSRQAKCGVPMVKGAAADWVRKNNIAQWHASSNVRANGMGQCQVTSMIKCLPSRAKVAAGENFEKGIKQNSFCVDGTK
jgi:hypothetical protein